jgi:hypothetical protein
VERDAGVERNFGVKAAVGAAILDMADIVAETLRISNA